MDNEIKNYTPLPIPLNPHTDKKRRAFKNLFIGMLRSPEAAGNVMVAVELLGIARRTIYDWRKDDPEFADKWDEAVIEGKQTLKMEAESALRKLIKKENVTAIIFTLKSLGREEWGDKIQLVNTSKHDITYYDFTEKQRDNFNVKFDEWFNQKYRQPRQLTKMS